MEVMTRTTKIAVPSDDRATVAQHFGRSAGFLVFHYDGRDMISEYRSLPVAPSGDCGSDGGGRHQRILDAIRDCDVVVAGGMGEPMLAALYSAGVDVVLSTVSDARKAAEMLVSDLLPQYSGSGCCQH